LRGKGQGVFALAFPLRIAGTDKWDSEKQLRLKGHGRSYKNTGGGTDSEEATSEREAHRHAHAPRVLAL